MIIFLQKLTIRCILDEIYAHTIQFLTKCKCEVVNLKFKSIKDRVNFCSPCKYLNDDPSPPQIAPLEMFQYFVIGTRSDLWKICSIRQFFYSKLMLLITDFVMYVIGLNAVDSSNDF